MWLNHILTSIMPDNPNYLFSVTCTNSLHLSRQTTAVSKMCFQKYIRVLKTLKGCLTTHFQLHKSKEMENIEGKQGFGINDQFCQ